MASFDYRFYSCTKSLHLGGIELIYQRTKTDRAKKIRSGTHLISVTYLYKRARLESITVRINSNQNDFLVYPIFIRFRDSSKF